ncbi:MAG TPA: ABC transporter ATP-binding protein [Candidatus Nanoarchaeia archaeon]|nr:ABC transporter ATP-binding protein [Candidatus Nanoarchaeia archaeon]
MEPIIEIKNISKKYKIGSRQERYMTLRDGLVKFFLHPVAAIKALKKNEFWALSGISFAIAKGEAVGIIGANGAGKSTLLKILSRITPPTEGEIKISGRVSSLLEVGTGFNPELTGRENIMLNGAILGMRKKEIEAKMESIIEFSGVDKFIDTPIKHYSSGMSVRLAFSIAAHLDPDILIVDEVLAVGDAEFQKKCLGKMDEVVKKSGRTIIFVSHNMDAVESLCDRVVLLKGGRVIGDGKADEMIEKYLGENRNFFEKKWDENSAPGNEKVKLLKADLLSRENQPLSYISTATPFRIKLEFMNYADSIDLGFHVRFFSEDNIIAFNSVSPQKKYNRGLITAICDIPADLLNTKKYQVAVAARADYAPLYQIPEVLVFDVAEGGAEGLAIKFPGAVRPKLNWEIS